MYILIEREREKEEERKKERKKDAANNELSPNKKWIAIVHAIHKQQTTIRNVLRLNSCRSFRKLWPSHPPKIYIQLFATTAVCVRRRLGGVPLTFSSLQVLVAKSILDYKMASMGLRGKEIIVHTEIELEHIIENIAVILPATKYIHFAIIINSSMTISATGKSAFGLNLHPFSSFLKKR